jgi:hypothetical protein
MSASKGWQYCREDGDWCRIPIVCWDADDAAKEASSIIFRRVGGAVDWEPDTEKEIEFYKERLQYFKDKLNDLGVSDSITEMVEYYKTKIQKIIIE